MGVEVTERSCSRPPMNRRLVGAPAPKAGDVGIAAGFDSREQHPFRGSTIGEFDWSKVQARGLRGQDVGPLLGCHGIELAGDAGPVRCPVHPWMYIVDAVQPVRRRSPGFSQEGGITEIGVQGQALHQGAVHE